MTMLDAADATLADERAPSGDGARRIASIAPPAALLTDKPIDPKPSEAAIADTLNGLAAGIFLVDASRRIVRANTAGQDLLRGDDFLRSISGQLVARHAQANHALGELFADIGDALDVKRMALPLTAHDGERYVVHVLPLRSAARTGTGSADEAVAALFVRKVALDSPCGELVARTFELTPTELRVLLAIVEVGGVQETAIALGIAPTTVKTHLHHVFAKTGARRQADLVKLVAGFSNPLAD
jgi:DNA-binding CsgD family transcriptional regulator